jgi:hypothetical protein
LTRLELHQKALQPAVKCCSCASPGSLRLSLIQASDIVPSPSRSSASSPHPPLLLSFQSSTQVSLCFVACHLAEMSKRAMSPTNQTEVDQTTKLVKRSKAPDKSHKHEKYGGPMCDRCLEIPRAVHMKRRHTIMSLPRRPGKTTRYTFEEDPIRSLTRGMNKLFS